MTEASYAIAHDYALVAPAPDGVADAIAAVMLEHVDELRAALEPFGVAFEDLLDPTWMRAVRIGDVEPFRSAAAAPPPEEEVARTVLPLLDGLDDSETCSPDVCDETCSMRRAAAAARGGCCGSGEACSDRGGVRGDDE